MRDLAFPDLGPSGLWFVTFYFFPLAIIDQYKSAWKVAAFLRIPICIIAVLALGEVGFMFCGWNQPQAWFWGTSIYEYFWNSGML